jgi:hypothetical protein
MTNLARYRAISSSSSSSDSGRRLVWGSSNVSITLLRGHDYAKQYRKCLEEGLKRYKQELSKENTPVTVGALTDSPGLNNVIIMALPILGCEESKLLRRCKNSRHSIETPVSLDFCSCVIL